MTKDNTTRSFLGQVTGWPAIFFGTQKPRNHVGKGSSTIGPLVLKILHLITYLLLTYYHWKRIITISTHRIHVWYKYIYTNIGGILMVNVTIYSIHGSYGVCITHPLVRNITHSLRWKLSPWTWWSPEEKGQPNQSVEHRILWLCFRMTYTIIYTQKKIKGTIMSKDMIYSRGTIFSDKPTWK